MIDARVNDINVEDLFYYYDRYNFLYSEKKDKLKKIFNDVVSTWKQALGLPADLFLLLTHYNEDHDHFSSMSAWRSTFRSYCIQHMVSNSPENTRPILLQFLRMLENIEQNAIQVYYQPKTRFANNMFRHLADVAGDKHSYINTFSYFTINCNFKAFKWTPMFVEHLQTNNKQEVLAFINRERGAFYSWVQGFDVDDFNLAGTNSGYQQQGLSRSRKVMVFKDDHGKIIAVAINNKASIGLNFSLLENACELIISSDISTKVITQTLNNILIYIQHDYRCSKLDNVFLLVDPRFSDCVTHCGGQLARTYDYFTCDHTMIDTWKDYLINESKEVSQYLAKKPRTHQAAVKI